MWSVSRYRYFGLRVIVVVEDFCRQEPKVYPHHHAKATGGMVLETGVLPPPLQLYAAAAAHLTPRPPWAPLLHFPGAASLFGMPGTFGPLARPRYPPPGVRAPTGPPSEDSGSETHSPNKGKRQVFYKNSLQLIT